MLAADQCLAALVEDGGLRVERGRPVASVRDGGSGGQGGGAGASVVMVDGEVLEADVVVVCAGPSSLGLVDADGVGGVGGGLGSVAAAPSLPQVAYFRSHGTDGGVPVFIEWGDDMAYGLPVLGDGPHAGLFKVSHHTPGATLERYDPADRRARCLTTMRKSERSASGAPAAARS